MIERPSPIARNCAPGAMYVRIVTSKGRLLDAHPIGEKGHDQMVLEQAADEQLAETWCETHPDQSVYVYVYDGDDGRCVSAIVISPRHDNPL